MTLWTIVPIILVLILVGALPTWGYHSYGYYPAGGLAGLVLLAVIILLLAGRL